MKFCSHILAYAIALAAAAGSPLEAQIINEQPNGVAERMFFTYGEDPMATLNSYAVAQVVSNSSSLWPGTSCTGTMIGPNAMITAAHCHGDRKTATFRGYRSATQLKSESFQCDFLIHTWPENDFALHWCFANSMGQNPGDKWGYVDFELDLLSNGRVNHNRSRDAVKVGADIYSIWWNPINSIGGNHHIFSEGKITDHLAPLWANSGGDHCSQDDDNELGVKTDAWGAGGASGSLQFWKTTGRAMLAPLSTASSNPDGGPSRSASAMIDILNYSQIWDTRVENPLVPPGCKGRLEPYINLRVLQRLWDAGIQFDPVWSNFTKYLGSVDKNRNGVIDIQEDLERSAKDGSRDFYYFSFNSNRTNVQQSLGSSASINWLGFLGFLASEELSSTSDYKGETLSDPRLLIEFASLNLNPNQAYRVLVNSHSDSILPGALKICMETCIDVPFGNDLKDSSVASFSEGGRLTLTSRTDEASVVVDTSISTRSTVFDFDTADKRLIWSARAGAPARLDPADIRPNGRQSANGIDWAGIVSDRRVSTAPEFSLSTHLIPIPKGSAQICFEATGMPKSSTDGKGIFRFVSSSSKIMEFDLPVTGWTKVCSPFQNVSEKGSQLLFGSLARSDFSYAVDNIVINWQSIQVIDAPDNEGIFVDQ